MKTPRDVQDFPERGSHIGDLIRLPSGQVYEWISFKRWQRNTLRERDLELERKIYERMLRRHSEASRNYTKGKFR